MSEQNATIAEMIGDPNEVDAQLQQFREDAKLLSSRRRKLIDEYGKKWIAIHRRKVVASAPSLDEVLKAVQGLGLRREDLVVRFVDNNIRRMIL